MTIFDTLQHPRSSTSGEFVDKAQSPAEVSLKKPISPSQQRIQNFDYAEVIRTGDRRAANLAAAKLLADTRLAITDLGVRRGLSDTQIDDAVGDSLASLSVNIRNGGSVRRGLIQHRSLSIVTSAAAGPVRHETARGRKLVQEKVEQREIEAGRLLTEHEVTAIAQHIRDNWPDPRHRPVEGFHLDSVVAPTVPAEHTDLVQLEERRAPRDEESESFASRQQLEKRIDDGLAAKQHAWTVFAEATDLPQPTPGWIQKSDARNVAAHCAGRIAEIAADHLAGVRGRDQVGLFAPFAHLSSEDRDEVARALASHPGFAERLWASALTEATGARVKRTAAAI